MPVISEQPRCASLLFLWAIPHSGDCVYLLLSRLLFVKGEWRVSCPTRGEGSASSRIQAKRN
ncbi:hypothetical protein Taro_019357 [Colocasia esculenta]|uniref:Uncharacterized protein n=1 Tax=Colocasia esculenta TaxID=4460 RepID=A0A843UZ11_COLES|nr:hypothetical protein [Colocasia esculenta]